MEPQNEMTLEIPGVPENVGLARVAVAAFASQLEFTLGEIEEIKVAISEAVSNSVIHAYNGKPGRVRIAVARLGNRLEIVVRDWGAGIADVEKARQPSFSTQPDRMGLGFVFMESFMDGLEVSSKSGEGTTVKMWKECRSDRSERVGGRESESC